MKEIHGGVLYFCDNEEHLLCNASKRVSDNDKPTHENKIIETNEDKNCHEDVHAGLVKYEYANKDCEDDVHANNYENKNSDEDDVDFQENKMLVINFDIL